MEQSKAAYEAYLQRLAEGNLEKGVLYEPRMYFDVFQGVTEGGRVRSEGGVFRNGEQFPVRLTHLTASTAFQNSEGQPIDERAIQRIGMYLQFHDQYYMNPPFQSLGTNLSVAATPVPAWGNKIVATSDNVNQGGTTTKFPQPFILSVRDTLRVQLNAQTQDQLDSPVGVSVSFTGVGILSRQPYFLTGATLVSDTKVVEIPSTNYINDGIEPILITEMSTLTSGELDFETDITGDARRISLQIRQVGNGTNADWVQGPQNKGIVEAAPTILWGQYAGRAVVHEFPGKGLLWEPGESIDVEVIGLEGLGRQANVDFLVGLTGYIAVE